MIALIKKTDPRILLFAVITLIAVTFSIFKAVGSLSGEVDSPGYRNQPPQAFARPLPERIVDPEYLDQDTGRLSDQGYQFAYRSAIDLSKKIINGRINADSLQFWGLDAASARRQALFLQGQYRARFAGRESDLRGTPELLLASGTSAEVRQQIYYSESAQDPQPGFTYIGYKIVSSDSRRGWRLSSVNIYD